MQKLRNFPGTCHSDWCLIEFVRCTILDFISLIFPHIYSLSLECSRYNTSLTSILLISELLKQLSVLSWFLTVLLVLLKYKLVGVSKTPCVFPFLQVTLWLLLPNQNLLYHTIAVYLCLVVWVFLLYLYIVKKYLKLYFLLYNTVIKDVKI